MQSLKRNLILALVLGVAVYLVLAIISGLGELRLALSGFRYSLVPAILGLVTLSYAGRYLRWNYYLKLLGVRIPFVQNVAIFVAGLSMTVSPGKLGEVLKSVFVRHVSGEPIARTAPAVVAERATDGTGMALWALLGALSFPFGLEAIFGFLAATVFMVAVLRSKRLSLLVERILRRLPLLNRLAPHVADFHGASNKLLATWPLMIGTLFSFCCWGLEILAVYLCVLAIGAEAPFLVVVFVFAVGSLAGAVSMVPGGIGVADAGFAGLFRSLADLPGGLAVGLTFVIRLATLWYATLLGLVGLLVVRRVIGEPVGKAADEAISEANEGEDIGTRPASGLDREP